MDSKKFELNKKDMLKVGKGLLIAVGGAACTYIAQAVTQFDFGIYSPVVVSGFSVLINFLRKFLNGLK